MAARSNELLAVGRLLRDLARTERVAIVVANQVTDRFAPLSSTPPPPPQRRSQSSPLARRGGGGVTGALVAGMPDSSIATPTPRYAARRARDALTLDYQQRFFTGWGDEGGGGGRDLKTPSLGLVWTSQVAARVALVKGPVYEEGGGGERVLGGWRRWVKVVFAAWVAPAGGDGDERGVEVEIWEGGVRGVLMQGEGEGVDSSRAGA